MSSDSSDGGESASQRRVLGLFRPETFAPFAYRDYRVLWLAIFVRSAALWLEMVARPVLIIELTGSAFLLGAVLAAWMLPNLILSPFAGVIVDRYPYRLALAGSFVARVASSGMLFVLLLFDQVEGWQVIALAAVSGISQGFFNPAQRAIVPILVDKSHLRSAMAHSQTGRTSMRIGGALLAGLLLQFAGFTWIFGLATVLSVFAAAFVLVIRARQEPHDSSHHEGQSIIRRITAGAHWAIETRWPLVVLAISAALFIFLHPFQGVMIPLIVIDELGQHRSWVGYLIAIGGVGATLGAIALASMAEIRSPRALMVGIIIVGGIALSGLAYAPHIGVVAVCVFFGSACVSNMMTVANLALVAHAPERLRGQALSLMTLVVGTSLIGALLAGALADTIGVRFGLLTMSACLLACALLALSTTRVRWWLWRRQMYAGVSKEEWLRNSEDDS